MIADRWTFLVKPGCYDKALKMMKAELERTGIQARIYVMGFPSLFGPLGRIIWEKEFTDDEERKKFWSDYFSEPEAMEYIEKLYALLESDGLHELWGLA